MNQVTAPIIGSTLCQYGSFSPSKNCNCVFCQRNRLQVQLAQQADLLRQALELFEEIYRIASGEDQVAMDDTEGMNHIYYKAQSLIPAIERALEKVK